MTQLGDEKLTAKALWRNVEKLGATKDAVVEHAQYLFVLHAAIDGISKDTFLTQVVDLVFHQGDERSDNNADTFQCHCWHLEGDALTATCGH